MIELATVNLCFNTVSQISSLCFPLNLVLETGLNLLFQCSLILLYVLYDPLKNVQIILRR